MTPACNFIAKEAPTHIFSCEFCETFKNISERRLVFSANGYFFH